MNLRSNTNKEIKFKQEESMDTNISEVSTLDLDDVSESDKLNSAKRKHEVLPLLVSNLPEKYSLQEIEDYLEKLCGPCEVSVSKNEDGSNTVEAIFRSTTERIKAKRILSCQTINNVKIRVESPDYESESIDNESENEGPQAKRKKEREDIPWGLDMDVWKTDPRGWYGVKPQYLASLGINERLHNWVIVLNFRCGREELKEVMDLAGDVVVCTMHSPSTKRYANVMYRHPLEALQAVSMLNGQMFYGRPLTVKIANINGLILPKGLNNVGPGLAKYGRPLRDVVRHYEWYIKGQDNALNSNIFRTPQDQLSNDDDNYSENDDNERKAIEALETLVSLVDQGVKVKDLLLELRSIKAYKKNSVEQILKELDTSDAESNYDRNDVSPPGTSVPNEPKSENVRSSSVNSKSSNKSPNPDFIKSSKELTGTASSQSSQQISTISSVRSSESWLKPTVQTRPVAPAPRFQGGFGDQRHMGPGPSRPLSGPMSGLGSVGPRGMIGPGGPMSGRGGMPMQGPMQGPMPGPMQGPMPGPMQGPMPGPVQGPIPGPMQGPMPGPRPGSMPGPMSALPMAMSGRPVSGPAGPMSGPMPAPNFLMRGPNNHPPFGPSVHPTSGPVATLQFSNLPPSTTFALLSDKLSQVGQLVSIQFTTPGCVVVKFAHRSHAEMCIQQFDQSRLEGNLINVKFI